MDTCIDDLRAEIQALKNENEVVISEIRSLSEALKEGRKTLNKGRKK